MEMRHKERERNRELGFEVLQGVTMDTIAKLSTKLSQLQYLHQETRFYSTVELLKTQFMLFLFLQCTVILDSCNCQ